ncbi:MAG: hypothetical protein H5T98_04850 [Syntrophomonadaceae bacterium]|nr:hypothetical protein [Syntrophomonadaceae bacterium]
MHGNAFIDILINTALDKELKEIEKAAAACAVCGNLMSDGVCRHCKNNAE